MNCKPGILAVIVVPSDWPSKKLDGRVVEVVRLHGPLGDPMKDQRPTWWCKFPTPWFSNRKPVHQCPILDSWLRPISGVPLDHETAITTDAPNAQRLLLSGESGSCA